MNSRYLFLAAALAACTSAKVPLKASDAGTSSGCTIDADCVAMGDPCRTATCGTGTCAVCKSNGTCATQARQACVPQPPPDGGSDAGTSDAGTSDAGVSDGGVSDDGGTGSVALPDAGVGGKLEARCCATVDGGVGTIDYFEASPGYAHGYALTALDPNTNEGDLYVGAFSATGPAQLKRLVPTGVIGVSSQTTFWSPDGAHLLFEADIGATDGMPALYLATSDGAGATKLDGSIFGVGAAGGHVRYLKAAATQNDLYLLGWTDAAGTKVASACATAHLTDDGAHLGWVNAIDAKTGAGTLVTATTAAPTATHTLSTAKVDPSFTWAPDGLHVGWVEGFDQAAPAFRGALKVGAWDASTAPVAIAAAASDALNFSPRSGYLAYLFDAGTHHELGMHAVAATSAANDWTYDLGTGGVVTSWQFADDDSTLVFQTDDGKKSAVFTIATSVAPTAAPTAIGVAVSDPPLDSTGAPQWQRSLDWTLAPGRLAVLTITAATNDGPLDLYDLAGKSPQHVSDAALDGAFTFSHDGARLFYVESDPVSGFAKTHVFTVAGGADVAEPGLVDPTNPPAWAGNGWLVYVTNIGATGEDLVADPAAHGPGRVDGPLQLWYVPSDVDGKAFYAKDDGLYGVDLPAAAH